MHLGWRGYFIWSRTYRWRLFILLTQQKGTWCQDSWTEQWGDSKLAFRRVRSGSRHYLQWEGTPKSSSVCPAHLCTGQFNHQSCSLRMLLEEWTLGLWEVAAGSVWMINILRETELRYLKSTTVQYSKYFKLDNFFSSKEVFFVVVCATIFFC